MSEEIIIDGVDVSECEDLSRFEDGCCCGKQYEEFASCEGYDCAYKQLKRLQAENERLREEIYATRDNRLKMYESFETECNKYRKALEEIREIAENYFEECGVPDDYFKRNNYSWKQHQIKGLTCKLQQIFDKSNEVLR